MACPFPRAVKLCPPAQHHGIPENLEDFQKFYTLNDLAY
jgi:hypothetical protein